MNKCKKIIGSLVIIWTLAWCSNPLENNKKDTRDQALKLLDSSWGFLDTKLPKKKKEQ